MTNKYYYKIINDNTGRVDLYVSVDVPVKDEKVCDILDLKGRHAKSITKEEFVKETN